MTALPNAFEQALYNALKPWLTAKVWRVAFSGGLDSSALLHGLSRLQAQYRLPVLHAHYIDHGLQAAAKTWPKHCQNFCLERGIAFEAHRAQVADHASLEQAAREARYQVLSSLVGVDEVLLTAQHQDDQAETFLFRALRGAGVRGLSAMPACRELGQGKLVRPLLNLSRGTLEQYGREQRLEWIEDPSNTDTRFARNFLRQQVLPILLTKWPKAAQTLARAAHHQREAQQLLDELAELDLAQARTCVDNWPYPVLALEPIKALSDARQRNVLRYWLSRWIKLPDAEHWQGWVNLRDAKASATPVWTLDGWQLYRADQRLWLVPVYWGAPAEAAPILIQKNGPIPLPNNGYVDVDVPLAAGIWSIRYRVGGESMYLASRGQRDLKRLLNEARVPGFMRQRLPLLYCDEKLVAVANHPSLCAEDVKLKWHLLTD